MFELCANQAHRLVEYSLKKADAQSYLASWLLTIPARLCFVVDLVVQTAAIPLFVLQTFFGLLETSYTWGHSTQQLEKGTEGVLNSCRRIFLSLLGALISTHFAYICNEISFIEIGKEAWPFELEPRSCSFGLFGLRFFFNRKPRTPAPAV